MASLGIHGSIIQSARDTHVQVTNNQSTPKDAMQILKEHVAFGALFNSKERFDPPKCHPDTRKAVLDTIDRWARGLDDPSKPIMWLRGAMGAGKSAIAQTSAELWAELKILAASFFFSRTIGGRNDNTRFIPTLAYQLLLSIPATRPHIEHAILDDIGLFQKSLLHQMKALLIQPLTAAGLDGDLGQQVIVIDGLDECCLDRAGKDHEAQQREILDAIASYASQPDCPVRFLVASRPELQIRTSFQHTSLATSTRPMVLDHTQNPNADIELYLECRFSEIRHKYPSIASSWPPEGTIRILVDKSSGHFIYASTTVRYLERPRQDPRLALEAIMNTTATVNTKDSPFAELDALYLLIMHFVTPESLPIVLSIFGIMCYPSPLQTSSSLYAFLGCPVLSPVFLEHYLFLTSGSLTYTHLVDLHSILEIPPESKSKEVAIRFIHASFSEFLTNQSRSGAFCVDRDVAMTRLLPLYLKHIFIQYLQPDLGEELGYEASAFLAQLIVILDNDKPSPSQGFIEGLTALIGEDEGVFAEYVCNANLAHFGGVRNNLSLKQWLTEGFFNDNSGVKVILAYLKKHGVRNLKTLIEGCEIRDGEIIYSHLAVLVSRFSPLPSLLYSPGPLLEDQYKTPATPDDERADEPSATTQAGTYYPHAAKSRGRTSKKRRREVDLPPLQAPAPSGSQRITRSIAKLAATDAPHPKVAKPVSTAKGPMSGKKKLKEATAKSKKRRRR